jgi:hypothetical protein
VDCWSCDTPNAANRLFCVSCGSFIAIGSGVVPPPPAEPFSGPPPVPGDADADVSLPFVDGVPPLGSYSAEEHRRATRRTRTGMAVVSVVLAMVVGGAALYLASPLSDRGGSPETAGLLSAPATPAATDTTAAVRGISIEPPAAARAEVGAITPPETAAEPPRELEPARVVKPADDVGLMPPEEPEPEPLEPVVAVEPEPPVDPVPEAGSQRQPEPAAPVEAGASLALPPPASRPNRDTSSSYAGGWFCEGAVVIDDSRVRDWSLGRVSFRARPGFERVVLHLERAGIGSGEPASITAEARPSNGRTTIALQLDDGFTGNLGLRGYRPSGLATITELSVFPRGRDGRNVLISTTSNGCFRVRVPAWSDPSGSVRRGDIIIDLKP